MTRKEELFLSLAYWIASLDGNLDLNETKIISESKFFNSFYSKTNFNHCKKTVDQIKKTKDAKAFLKEIFNPLLTSSNTSDIFTQDEQIVLLNELCEIASADNNFDDLEKQYINLLAKELGLEKENIPEKFSNTSNIKTKEVSGGLKLNKKELGMAYASKENELSLVVKQKLQNQIEKELSINGFEISVDGLTIRKTHRLSVHTLFDERKIEHRTEVNYSGVSVVSSKSSSDINLFEEECTAGPPHRFDYKFKNYSSNKKYRVSETNDTRTCYSCKGRKQVVCYNCNGARELTCSNCSGKGQNKCGTCNGDGYNDCFWCSNGYKDEYDSSLGRSVKKRCNSCSGQGRNPCSSCQSGYVTCSTCTGAGKVTCYTCSGQGLIDCSSCSAQGSFTDFLQISSTLEKTINSTFLNEEPDRNFCSKNLYSEESNYNKLFGKYEFKDLKEYSSEIKNLFVQQKFSKNQQPKITKFELDDCLSMSFRILIGDNVYLGGLNSNGELFYDLTILDQLFFNIIKSLDVNKEFKALEVIKAPITTQIPEFKETYDKINQYKAFVTIINSTGNKNEKLNKVRKLKKINTEKYCKNLISIIKKKTQKILIPFLLLSHLVFWFLFPVWTLLIIGSFLICLLIGNFSLKNHLKNISKDATKTLSKSMTSATISLITLFTLIFILNNSTNRTMTLQNETSDYYNDNSYMFYDSLIEEVFLVYNIDYEGSDVSIPFHKFRLPYFDPFDINKFGIRSVFEDNSNISLRILESINLLSSNFQGYFTFISCSECDEDGVRSGNSFGQRRVNSNQDPNSGYGNIDSWNEKSISERASYKIPQYNWKWDSNNDESINDSDNNINQQSLNFVTEETFKVFKENFEVVHKSEIISKATLSYDSYQPSFENVERAYALDQLLTDSVIVIKSSNTKVNYYFVDKNINWSCLSCSGYVCSKCSDTKVGQRTYLSNRSGSIPKKTYLRLSEEKFNNLNPNGNTYGSDDYSVGGTGSNFFTGLDVGGGFIDSQGFSHEFNAGYSGLSYGGSNRDDWNSISNRYTRSYQDSEEINRFNFVISVSQIKKEKRSDYGVYIMQNDFEVFKRMLTSNANLPDPSKNPFSRNDGRNFFHHYFYNNVASKYKDGKYERPLYLEDKSYDFYHLLIGESKFRELFKDNAQKYINESREYVVQ